MTALTPAEAAFLTALQAAGGPVHFADLAALLHPGKPMHKALRTCRVVAHRLRAKGVPLQSRQRVGYWLGRPGEAAVRAWAAAGAGGHGLSGHRAERVRPDEHELLRGLWAEVLAVAIEDAAGQPRCASNLRRNEAAAVTADARAWLGSRQFEAVCWLAGFDPAAVMSRVRVLGLGTVAQRIAPRQPVAPAGASLGASFGAASGMQDGRLERVT